MELWVRNQDKEILLKVNELEVETNMIIAFDGNKYQCLGTYKSKQRALEVLDDIQRILHPTVFMSAEINTDDNNWVENGIIYQKYKDNFNIQELSTYVYEMPKE